MKGITLCKYMHECLKQHISQTYTSIYILLLQNRVHVSLFTRDDTKCCWICDTFKEIPGAAKESDITQPNQGDNSCALFIFVCVHMHALWGCTCALECKHGVSCIGIERGLST